jgi:hypothetical protein
MSARCLLSWHRARATNCAQRRTRQVSPLAAPSGGGAHSPGPARRTPQPGRLQRCTGCLARLVIALALGVEPGAECRHGLTTPPPHCDPQRRPRGDAELDSVGAEAARRRLFGRRRAPGLGIREQTRQAAIPGQRGTAVEQRVASSKLSGAIWPSHVRASAGCDRTPQYCDDTWARRGAELRRRLPELRRRLPELRRRLPELVERLEPVPVVPGADDQPVTHRV